MASASLESGAMRRMAFDKIHRERGDVRAWDERFFNDCLSKVSSWFVEGVKGIAAAPWGCTPEGINVATVIESDVIDARSDVQEDDISKPNCVNYLSPFRKRENEVCETFEPGIPDFYDKVELCYDVDTPAKAVQFSKDSINTAGKAAVKILNGYFGMFPKFDKVTVYFRPYCSEEGEQPNEYPGRAFLSEIERYPAYCSSKGATPEQAAVEQRTLFHEFCHSLVSPGLAEDPGLIIEEGLCALAEFMFNLEHSDDDDSLVTGVFPDEPVVPFIASGKIYKGYIRDLIDRDGGAHYLYIPKVEKDADGNFDIKAVLDEVEYSLKGDGCTSIGYPEGYMLCLAGKKNPGYELVAFKWSDSIERYLISKELNVWAGDRDSYVEYSLSNLVWGYDSNAKPSVFEFERSKTNLKFENIEQGEQLISWEQYEAVRFLLTGAERMFWKSHPEKHPNDFMLAFSNINNAFTSELYSPGYDSMQNNIYHRLADELDIPEDKWFSLLKLFHLDPECFEEVQPYCMK